MSLLKLTWTLLVLSLSTATPTNRRDDDTHTTTTDPSSSTARTLSSSSSTTPLTINRTMAAAGESSRQPTELKIANFSRHAADLSSDFEDYDERISQKDVDEAVEVGMKMMQDLYLVKEPKLYKMGLYLDEREPAGRMAAFSSPNQQAQLQARFGFATLQASKRLREKFPENGRSRQNPETVSFLRTSVLDDQCPLRGLPRCPPASKRYRTADGTCNNLDLPWKGASMLPMQRFLLPEYDDEIQSVRRSVRGGARLPSAREISIRIHRDRDVETEGITMMFMQWGQFLDHDITSTAQGRAFNGSIPRCCARGGTAFLPPEFMHPDCLPISVPDDDWFLGRFGIRCLEFVRSAPSSRIDCDLGWREQINQVTSFIDASTVYGSDSQRSDSLRIFRNGLMQYGRLRSNNQEPPDPPEGEICRMGAVSTDCFKGGDNRAGEQPGLTAFHTTWLRYHNRIAAIIGNLNSHWSDEKVYQETRRIIGAMIQHITYKEFLPIVLGQEVMDLFELNLERKGFYKGYDSKVNPAPANAFSAAAFRFGHSLVQNSYVRSDAKHRPLFNNVTIHEEQQNPQNIWSVASVDRLILGFCNQPSQRRDEFIGKELTNHLFQTPSQPFGMDLAAVNIQRGRDHGIPSYTAWREPCGLSPIRTWQDLEHTMSHETVQRFRSLYDDVEDIDLYPGGLAERPVRGGVVGPTFACIIAQQFTNLRKGDRFWYENGDFESSFTPAQLQQIRKTTFSQVICHVMPEIETIQPFVFLGPDNFRNARLPCGSPDLNNIDFRAWEERKRAESDWGQQFGQRFDEAFNNIHNKIEFESKESSKNKIVLSNTKIKNKVDNKLDFGGNKTASVINNKLDFSKNKTRPNIDDKKKPEKLQVLHVNHQLDFGSTTKKPTTIDDFEVLFFTSPLKSTKKKNEKNLDMQVDSIFGGRKKRGIMSDLDYYDDDYSDEEAEEIFPRKSGKKKRKKKPTRSTARPKVRPTVYIQDDDEDDDDPYNPIKIHVSNITSQTVDISEQKYDRYSGQQEYHNPQYYDEEDRYILHPTITKNNANKPPDYQVNINIQYISPSTPKTDILINSRPNVHIMNEPYYATTKRPPIRITKRPYNSDPYIYASSKPPHSSTYKIRPHEPSYVTSRPYDHDRFEDKPFSTSKRPYIYRPSESYLSMFDELHTTKRPVYINSYVDKVTKRPNIPSYLYLPNTFYKNDNIGNIRDVYKQLMMSTTRLPIEEQEEEEEEEDYEDNYRHPGDRNFVKISSVQGKRLVNGNTKEELIHTVQQKEGELDLFDGLEDAIELPIEDDVEKLLVDIIPRENRKDDWLFFNEVNEEKAPMEEPLLRSLNANDNDTAAELPKPLNDFWHKQDAKKNHTEGRSL